MPPTLAPGTTDVHRSRWIPGILLLLAVGLGACDEVTDVALRANPLTGLHLYVPYPSAASAQADAWWESRPLDAAALDRIAREPRGVWLTDGAAPATVASVLAAGRAEDAVPILVVYNIPYRNCAPGAADAAAYRDWVRRVADADEAGDRRAGAGRPGGGELRSRSSGAPRAPRLRHRLAAPP